MPATYEIMAYWELGILALIVAGLYGFANGAGLIAGTEYVLRAIAQLATIIPNFWANSQGFLAAPASSMKRLKKLPLNKFELQRRVTGKQSHGPPIETVVLPAVQMTPEEQWRRVSNVISESIERTRTLDQLNTSAARQLDAVDYEYLKMIDELSAILPHVEMASANLRRTQVRQAKTTETKPLPVATEPTSIAA